MIVRAYANQDLPHVMRLLEELQRYVVSVDSEGLNILGDNFADQYTANLLSKVDKNQGCIFVAEENGRIIGMIAGTIEVFNEDDKLTYKCPVEGRVIELVVNSEYRNKSVGALLMTQMESYFVDMECEYIRIEVLSSNVNAIGFYKSQGYQTRTEELFRKL